MIAEVFFMYFTLLGYQVVLTDNIPFDNYSYINVKQKIVYFNESTMMQKDCFGMTLLEHEMLHAYQNLNKDKIINFHQNGCVFG